MAAKPWIVKTLVLPVGEKEYEVQPVEYDVGLTLITVFKGTSTDITADTADEKMFRLVMGTVWDEMIADRLPYPVVFRAGMAATEYQVSLLGGMDSDGAVAAGERMWESGIDPEALAAALKAAATPNGTTPQDSTPSNSTESAPVTPSRGRSRSTTSRQGTTRAAPKKATRSTGKPSPVSGH